MAAAASTVARALLLCLVAASLALSSSAQSCTTLTFPRSGDFALCRSLQRLGSTLHWTYHPSNGTVDIAFRAPQSNTGWVAWGINPQALRMTGTQALVAFVNGSTGRVAPYTTSVTVAPLQPSSITIPATNLQGDFSGGFYTIYATLQLTNNQTRVNQVWQSSTAFSGGFPAGHATTGENVQSLGSLDFLSGESTSGGSPANAPSGGSPPPPTPFDGSPATAPSGGCPSPSNGSPAPAPSGGSPAPSRGSPAPAPSGGSPVAPPPGGIPTPSNGSPAPSSGNPTPSGATLLPARLYVCACACMFAWMLMYVGM
ncbi:hypothetical protein Taro_001947 [Colocasia esculenta]|uniref:DOMON domain-containing protein n=1 Tax=Colocasia esculenta TaxID=4460 RepID=A0A843THD2_COLES|nr:hypothetical protein [Colocasia esculenta]